MNPLVLVKLRIILLHRVILDGFVVDNRSVCANNRYSYAYWTVHHLDI